MTSTLPLSLRARNAGRSQRRYQICLIHPFDPRGEKVGGLETYIRDFITFHPVDTDLLFIGVDSRGDLTLGKLHKLTFRGRNFDFLPILHYPDQHAREAARSVRSSLTGQFFMALMRHFAAEGTDAHRLCTTDEGWVERFGREILISYKKAPARERLTLELYFWQKSVAFEFLRIFAGRVVNIHPSLLPAFPGLEAWKQAWEYGVKVTGCTVHLVDQGIDSGPILAQETVAVLPEDTPSTLHERIQEAERRLYPRVISALATGRITTQGRQVTWRST